MTHGVFLVLNVKTLEPVTCCKPRRAALRNTFSTSTSSLALPSKYSAPTSSHHCRAALRDTCKETWRCYSGNVRCKGTLWNSILVRPSSSFTFCTFIYSIFFAIFCAAVCSGLITVIFIVQLFSGLHCGRQRKNFIMQGNLLLALCMWH